MKFQLRKSLGGWAVYVKVGRYNLLVHYLNKWYRDVIPQDAKPLSISLFRLKA